MIESFIVPQWRRTAPGTPAGDRAASGRAPSAQQSQHCIQSVVETKKMKFSGATLAVAAAAAAVAIARSGIGSAVAAEDSLVVEAAESVRLLCPAEAACKLEMGVAFGDPWVSAEAGDIGYFEV